MNAQIEVIGGGCGCRDANNYRHQMTKLTGVQLPDLVCSHTYAAATDAPPRIKAKGKGKKKD